MAYSNRRSTQIQIGRELAMRTPKGKNSDASERLSAKQFDIELQKQGSRDLDTWVDAGMDRRALLSLLGSVAFNDHAWVKEMRMRHAGLKSLAKRLKTLTRDAENFINNRNSQVEV